MAGWVKKIKIGHFGFRVVFRHKWDDDEYSYSRIHEYKTKRLGIFFRKDKCVGVEKKGKEMFGKDNLYPSYMFGLNLIWAKCWITIDYKVKHF